MSTKKQKKAKKLAAETKTNSLEGRAAFFLFFAAALFFFLWGSWLLPLTDPVESNYALTAKEMVMAGDWMSPRIYGAYWYDKPIMVYWMLCASYSLFGFTDLASRLPSALAGALSVVLIIWYMRRILKDNVQAVWAGTMLAVSLECWVISHAIITDNLLLLFTIPTMLSAYIGITERNTKHLVIAYAAAGLACLTKGPVGLVLPGILLVLWCLSMKSPKTILRLFPWQGLLAFFAIVLPWYGGMYLIHGSDFVSEFLGLHNVLRATSSEHPADNHFYYYLLLLPAMTLPWSFLSFYEMWKGRKEKSPFYLFLMTWCWGTILFYTLMATKYVTYTYIAVIPLALLASYGALRIRMGEKVPALFAGAGFFLLLAVLTAGTFYIKGGNWWAFYAVAAYGVFAYILRWKANQYKRLTIITAVTASAFLCVVTEGLPHYLPLRSTVESAAAFHETKGAHYFFRSYPASYSYYTDETGIRLLPELANEEKRDAKWNEKYAMPCITEKDFFAKEQRGAVYLYVSQQDRKRFASWAHHDDFQEIERFACGTIYILVSSEQ